MKYIGLGNVRLSLNFFGFNDGHYNIIRTDAASTYMCVYRSCYIVEFLFKTNVYMYIALAKYGMEWCIAPSNILLAFQNDLINYVLLSLYIFV